MPTKIDYNIHERANAVKAEMKPILSVELVEKVAIWMGYFEQILFGRYVCARCFGAPAYTQAADVFNH